MKGQTDAAETLRSECEMISLDQGVIVANLWLILSLNHGLCGEDLQLLDVAFLSCCKSLCRLVTFLRWGRDEGTKLT